MSQQPLPSTVQPTDIYGGDEVDAIVLDPGYCTTRLGFAGEDVPKIVLPSFYLHRKDPPKNLFGDEYLLPRPDTEVRNYMSRDSVVEDWDAATGIWEDMLLKRLFPPWIFNQSEAAKDPEGFIPTKDPETPLQENPLLITEAPWNPTPAREKTVEIIMENWGCPAFWLSKTPVLAAFAAGKASALVIDVGGANTSVTAIHDGMVLKRSIQKSPVGGVWLSAQIRSMVHSCEPKIDLVPTFMIDTKSPVDAGAPPQYRSREYGFEIPASYRAFEEERLMTEFKESVVEVWRGGGRFAAPGNEEYARSQPGRVFEMPTGSNQMWREQRFRVSEGMWDETAAYPTSDDDHINKSQTIPEMIRAALNAVDVDLRGNLLNNIVVTGGTSLLNGFNDRLNNELMVMYPGMKVKIHAAGATTERRYGAWMGGSILTSLGTFHQMWISRKEYEEMGPGVVEKRCK